MTLDFTTISLPNLITLAVTIIIGIIVLKKAGITKLGPIDIEHEHRGDAANALVIHRLEDLDVKLHDNVSITTNQMMRQFLPPDNDLCYYGRRAITECILIPLRKRAACNHFTSHLSTQGNRDTYKQMIMDAIKDQYADVRPINSKAVCDADPQVPTWADVELECSKLVDEWIRRVVILTKETCQEKIGVYSDALSAVKGDKYWTKVFTDCKVKNERYIEQLV